MAQTKLTLDIILECERYVLSDLDGDNSIRSVIQDFALKRELSESEVEVLFDVISTRFALAENYRAENTLKVSLAKQYGNETIHPECDLSRGFASLLGQKTLTRANIESIKALGFKVRTVSEVL
jgi:hypothetical protein